MGWIFSTFALFGVLFTASAIFELHPAMTFVLGMICGAWAIIAGSKARDAE